MADEAAGGQGGGVLKIHGVIVSAHAVERLVERDRSQRRHPNPRALISWEIHRAFEAGRTARRMPRWVPSGAYTRRAQQQAKQSIGRFAWNEDETHCYLLKWASGPDGKRTWICVTTYVPQVLQETA